MEGFVPIPEEAARRYRSDALWSLYETIPSLLVDAARDFGDRDAVVDDSGRRLTYGELEDQSARLAGALEARGIGPGDVVGVQLPNRVEASLVACAIERLGAIVNPLVTVYRERELEYMCAKCETKALVVPGTFRRFDHEALALHVAERVPSLTTIVTLDDDPPPGTDSLAALLAEGSRAAARDIDPDAFAAVLFTSGTEADPKGVLHTHNTLLANCRAIATLLDMDEDDAVFMASPVGHGTGYGFGIRLALHLGGKLVLQETWNAAEAATLIAEERCAYTHASMPFAHDLLNVPGLGDRDLSCLRYFVTGGASVPSGFVTRIREHVGCLLLRLYGQTEAFMTTLNRPADLVETLESRDGAPVPSVEMQIWDDDGNEVPTGTPGEAVCRGAHRCVGFIRDEERARRSITVDGWLRMGDYCTMDEHGYVTVVGRKKEVINRGGYKYSPREVEDLVAVHADVDRVAVVRMDDERLGEKACIFVIPKSGATPTLETLVAYLREHGVAAYKWPERLELVDALPMTASGKVQKFVLEEQLRAAVRA